MNSIAIPASSINSAAWGLPDFSMAFARADNSVGLTLSIGWVAIFEQFNNVGTGYAGAPYKYTHTGNPLTKFRLTFWGQSGASWTAFGPVPAGTYWITGLQVTSISWVTSTQVKIANIAAGAFVDALGSNNAETESDTDSGLPKNRVISAGAAGRTITKLRYRFTQESALAGDWSGTPAGEAKLRRFS